MTDEEKAEEYVENKYHCNQLECIQGNSCDFCYYGECKQAFQDGAKWGIANAIQWHDLRKDPNDLPKKCNCYWGYVNYYGFQHREILWENNQFDVTGVIAWCELPQFKE